MVMTMRMATITLLLTAVAAVGVVSASPAHADRCEPEELVLGPGTSPIDERDHPGCYVLVYFVYPFVCADVSTLVNCAGSIDPDPFYRPNPPPFQPDAGRLYCGLYTFVLANGTCTFGTPPNS